MSLVTFTARADIIYFKDGMRTICQEKAWEENGEIKCEYAGWVISYEKNEVERILKTIPQKQPAKPKNKPKTEQSSEKGQKAKTSSSPEAIETAFYDPEGLTNTGRIKMQSTTATKKPSRLSPTSTNARRNGFKPTWATPMTSKKSIVILLIRI